MKNIFAIDTHSHFNHNVPYDTICDEKNKADIEYLNKMYTSANIEKVICSTFSSVLSPERVFEENEYLFEYAKQINWLYQWVVIDPRDPKTFQQVKVMLNSGKCAGIKLHPVYHKYSLDEYGDSIFSLASEFGAIVQIHPERDADYILPFADKYPDVKFIMAHLENESYVRAIEMAKHQNVYTDTSGSASVSNHILEYAVNRIGSEKILFGTDTYSAGFQRGRVEYALISDRDKSNILRDNAIKLFGNILT